MYEYDFGLSRSHSLDIEVKCLPVYACYLFGDSMLTSIMLSREKKNQYSANIGRHSLIDRLMELGVLVCFYGRFLSNFVPVTFHSVRVLSFVCVLFCRLFLLLSFFLLCSLLVFYFAFVLPVVFLHTCVILCLVTRVVLS